MTTQKMDNSSADMSGRADAILDFWFGKLDGDGMPAADVMRRWFESDSAFDDAVRTRFGADLERIDALSGLAADPRGALALVLLTDQFPRNIHRGTPQAFAFDERARGVTRRVIEAGHESALRPIERVFLYMPLEHAEDLALQDESVCRFRALAEEVPGHLRETFASFAWHAENHREVIARFGRFPHRNAVLGRESTAAERAYLAGGGENWGQAADRP